ncbi:porin [Thiohalophilus sp.]|uniref:porin n=1 Tax=Thiohalophilus sp. TaxID=3028392 RepID=UPI002ACEC3A4|nr:porin [Thiohalophilus sp.]MDZ7803253.1 hypothetical protein [Thiohalophilus sp.]
MIGQTNAILYSDEFDALELRVMYSADPYSENVSGGQDNNDDDLISVSLTYSANELTVGAALEDTWSLDTGKPGPREVDNLRLTASYTLDQYAVRCICQIPPTVMMLPTTGMLTGVNAECRFDEALDMRVQYLVADDHQRAGRLRGATAGTGRI